MFGEQSDERVGITLGRDEIVKPSMEIPIDVLFDGPIDSLTEVPVADDPENCMSCGKEEGLPGAER